MKILICDPPSGWQYGFPKACPRNIIGDEEFKNWLIRNGYPKKLVDQGLHKYTRWWEEEEQASEWDEWEEIREIEEKSDV